MQLPLIKSQTNTQTTKPWPSPSTAGETLEFGRFQILLRRRELLSDSVPIELGTRAFDLLLVLLEADGALVTKEELLRKVWPGIVVAEENLKVQIYALRKALGGDCDFIRTEFGRGYRFIAEIRSTAGWNACQRSTGQRQRHRWGRRPLAHGASRISRHNRRCAAGR
jgi:DNA-binding winged helix-turn-helix (wHTH) protein